MTVTIWTTYNNIYVNDGRWSSHLSKVKRKVGVPARLGRGIRHATSWVPKRDKFPTFWWRFFVFRHRFCWIWKSWNDSLHPIFLYQVRNISKKHCYIEISHGAWFNAATQVSVLFVQKSLNARMAPAQHRSPRRCSASENVSLKCNKIVVSEVETSPRAPRALITTAHSTLRAAANILVSNKTAGLRLTHWTGLNMSGQCPEKAGHYGNRPPAKVSIAVNWLNTYYNHIFWTRLVVLDIAVPIIVKGFGRNPNVTSVRFTFPAAIPISNLQPGCYEKYIAQHVDRCRLPEDTNKPHRLSQWNNGWVPKWQSEKREHTPNWLGKSSSESIHLHF